MSEVDPSEIDLDAMMLQIRAEVARRRGGTILPRATASGAVQANAARIPPDAAPETPFPPRLADLPAGMEAKDRCTLDDLLQFHDEAFVSNAYHRILRRDPDGQGLSTFLEALREGRMSKTEILGRMRFSPEGRAVGVPVSGLTFGFSLGTLRRVPVVGHLIGIVQDMVRLPKIVRSHERLEASQLHHELQLERHINVVEAKIESAMSGLDHRTSEIDSRQRIAQDRLAVEMADRLAGIATDITNLRADHHHLVATIGSDIAGLHVDHGQHVAMTRGDIASLRAEYRNHVITTEGVLRDLAAGVERVSVSKADHGETASALASMVERIGEIRSVIHEILERKVERSEIEKSMRDIDERIAQMRVALTNDFDSANVRMLQRLESQDAEFARISNQLSGFRLGLLDQQRRVKRLLDSAHVAQAGGDSIISRDIAAAEEPRVLDAFYLEFENRFRGTVEDIKSRVAIYVPAVVGAGAGTAGAPVVDLGSGRGEWLRVLKDQGLSGLGVDSNGVMAATCGEQGLEVIEGDAVGYMTAQPPDSVGAVTAMHFVEHIPFAQLVKLFDESFRVLRPGGVLIFETPNPENLVVGACNFYIDPTHHRPLPPVTLCYLAESRGFERIEVRRLHPSHAAPTLPDGSRALPESVESLLYGPQDYSILAYKPNMRHRENGSEHDGPAGR